MPPIHTSRVSLRISGEVLIPTEITQRLGSPPDFSHANGERIEIQQTGKFRIARSGIWLLGSEKCSPADVDQQIRNLFDKLTNDLAVWSWIYEHFSADLFVGLFMNGRNEGLSLTLETMKMMCDRRLEIGFDIYSGNWDE